MVKFNTSRCVFFLLVFAQFITAQNETNRWYFGKKAALNFSTNPPTTINGSAMKAIEGSASISDNAGNLLFYVRNDTIWNQLNQVMANGTGLLGYLSATESSIIIKKPGSVDLYYVFVLGTVTQTTAVYYSIVDMSLAASMGSVTIKNVLLSDIPATEKLGATSNCSGTGTWIMTHDWYSDVFRAYELTAAGLNTVAVLSPMGPYVPNGPNSSLGYQGYLKFSPNGKKIGVANGTSFSSYELYDFDNNTGVVSNSLVLATGHDFAYGCEFSPDGTKFYGTKLSNGDLYQWDLCAGSPQAIVASSVSLVISSPTNIVKGALQLAKNGKIYITRFNDQTLGVINNPNVAGSGCNFTEWGLTLTSGMCQLGLPNFVSSYFLPPFPFPFLHSATCNTVSFAMPAFTTSSQYCAAAGYTALSFPRWDFGDPLSGSSNSSTAANPVHVFTNNGSFTVQLVFDNSCRTDTLTQAIIVSGCLSLNQLSSNEILEIYPNPSSGVYNIKTGRAAKVLVLTQLGSILREYDFESGVNKVDLSHFSNGIYFIKVNGLQTFKIIKVE